MTKRAKITVGILAFLLIFLLVIYLLVDAVYVPQEEQVLYPQSELVESVFVAQNNQYVENEQLKNKHSFETVPYMVDVPEGSGAKIGTGTVYQVSDEYFAYVAEYTDQYDVQDVIASQFPVALLINYIPESTRITIHNEENGYINGFKAKYIADQLFVSDSITQQQAIVLGYALDVPEGNYFGNHMFVAVCTTNVSTDAANACAQILSMIIKTVRYDEALNSSLERAAEEKRLEEEKALEAAVNEPVAHEGEDVAPDNTSIVGDEVTEAVPIVVADDYTTFNLKVEWTQNNPDAVLELFFPDGLSYASPLESSSYGCVFTLSNVPAGTYTLRIMNYQACGEIATTISGDRVVKGE